MKSHKSKSLVFGSTVATFFLLCFALFSFILSQGCGGKDTDAVPSVDTGFADTGDEDGNMTDTSKPDPDTSGEDTDSKLDAGQDTSPDVGEKYRQACNLCQQRNGTCKGPSAMPTSGGMDKPKLAEQICNCDNPESFGEEDPEPCDDPCANEREVQYYGWDCPHVTNDNVKTYQVEVKDDKCMMKSGNGWGPWSEEVGAWRYDGGSELEQHTGAKWVTCTGSCYKPNKCTEP